MRIRIDEMRLIRLNQCTLSGLARYTLSWRSMEIRYKKYGSVNISPLDQARFLESLLRINPTIAIMEK